MILLDYPAKIWYDSLMKPLSNKKVDKVFWDVIRDNCDHDFKWSLQCGEVACDKCYTFYEKWIQKNA